MVTNKDLETLITIKEWDNVVLTTTEIAGVLCTAICAWETKEGEGALKPLAVIVNPNLFPLLKTPEGL